MIKNIFFYFDGVIIESLEAKAEAFWKLHLLYANDVAEEVVKYHSQNLGIDRYEKIRHCHKVLLGIDISNKNLMKFANKFSELVMENVVSSPLVDGARYFLEKYYSKLDLKIISATPTVELDHVLECKSLREFFSSIHGSPNSKSFWIKSIMTKNVEMKREHCLFIGDAISDYEAAKENSISFAFRLHDLNKESIECLRSVISFNNFYELEYKLKNSPKISIEGIW